MSTYFAILTKVGETKLANATALGSPLKFTQMGVGDGNGDLPVPIRTQKTLIHEVRRADLNQLKVDPVNANQIIVEQVLPENVGGWWIREIGIYDEDGDLCAVANCPPSYKPQLAEGSGRTQVVRVVLIVASTAVIELKIDPSVVLATHEYVESYTATKAHQHDASDITTGTLATARIPSLSVGKTTGLQAALDSKAPLDSPIFLNAPQAPTPPANDCSKRLANSAFVQAAISKRAFRAGLATQTFQVADATRAADAVNLGFADARYAQVDAISEGVGELFDWPDASTPSHGLFCNGAAVSRTTYAALFAIIGTRYGAGDGNTTFNVPDIPANYTTVQASGNEGTTTVGQVIAHTHAVYGGQGQSWQMQTGPNVPVNTLGSAVTSSTGGNANLAAGMRVRKCIRFK